MKISTEEVSRLLAVSPQDRIDRGHAVVAVPGEGRTSQGQQVTGSEVSPSALVEISPSAQEVQTYKRLINRLPDVREDRVNALKAQIQNGTYEVSGSDIADLIIRRTLADNTAL